MKTERFNLIIFLKNHLSFIMKSEAFDENYHGGIWTISAHEDQFEGLRIYDCQTKDEDNYAWGINILFEKELNKRGFFSEWYDQETIIISEKQQ